MLKLGLQYGTPHMCDRALKLGGASPVPGCRLPGLSTGDMLLSTAGPSILPAFGLRPAVPGGGECPRGVFPGVSHPQGCLGGIPAAISSWLHLVHVHVHSLMG